MRHGCGATYRHETREAEAGAAVEPVTLAELIDLDALLIRRLMRHRLCHHQRFGRRLRDDVVIAEQVRCDVEMMGRKQLFGLGRAKKSKSRHCLRLLRVPSGERVSAAGALRGDGSRGAGCPFVRLSDRANFCRRVTSRAKKKSDVGIQGDIRFREERGER